MRKKKAGARSMDFEVSPDDRIGGSPKRRGRAPAPKSRKPAKPGKPTDPPIPGGEDESKNYTITALPP